MITQIFFDAERKRFFRPLNSSRRELVAACLRALYDRLHGPAADYAHHLTRDALKELLLPVMREYRDALTDEAPDDELSTTDDDDPQSLVVMVIRALLTDGWLEQFADRTGLITAFRFSRPGKLFAEVLWSLDRPSRSRQRNMRGCRNALEAALSDKGDAHDLVDAYEYAEKVIEDLTDGIDYFHELVRHLMQTASVHTQWNEFVEFLDRFQRDYSKQLTADNATLNRQAIIQKLERLRTVSEGKFRRMDEQLRDIAHWAVKEHTGPSVYDWLLTRIEDIVDAACQSKQPGFLKAMETYLKRINGLALQSMMLRSGQTRQAYLAAIQKTAKASKEEQDRLLAHIGQFLAPAEVRLLDPASFKLKTATQRRKAVTVSIRPRPSREERLAATMSRAEAEAFSIPNEEVAQLLRRDLRVFQHPVRISALSTATARDLIRAMQAVEAVRSDVGADLTVKKLPTRLENAFYSGNDYEIDLKK
ncbi:Wadjet anti-phage system protein JetA family protein [Methylocaldum sp.]|uniref:Wadjet anti-phage system protein JetA family protein n=1 Tax=Methylocaldum sp. TaxID=1969727 RepID=UPI002D657847|nr:Wadjet anti-phage system protein JetA family protein [Methylocaldum sp.]HYE34376.1 Wadjet anti-phage system protein JetA family protein [Methylocaldum sp.]